MRAPPLADLLLAAAAVDAMRARRSPSMTLDELCRAEAALEWLDALPPAAHDASDLRQGERPDAPP